MEFNIKRESDNKKINMNGINLDNNDTFTTERDLFKSNPSNNNNDELGMEYLVGGDDGSEEDQEDQEQEEHDYNQDLESHGDRNPFQEEPLSDENYEKIQTEKSYYLSQLKRLHKKGSFSSKKFDMENSLNEIRSEVIRIKKELDMDYGINYCRQGLMFAISTIEMADGNYNDNSFGLKGWSQNVMTNIENYDSVFEELYDKYYTSVTVSPEIKLISMIAGSAFMFSLQKKMMGPQAPPRQREMQGPSIDTDELLQELNDLDMDEISNYSEKSDNSIILEAPKQDETKIIDIKKRGRPKKK